MPRSGASRSLIVMPQAPSTTPSRVIRNAISPSSRLTAARKLSASASPYGCGTRAVFSAMRRSLASVATALASSRRGARSTSRSVSRRGIQRSRKVCAGICSTRVMARAPSQATRGSRHPVSPSHGTRLGPPVRLDAGGPLLVCRLLLGRSLRHRKYGYVGAAFGFGTKLDATVYQCKQRVILAQSDIMAGMPLGAALARENIAGQDRLSAEHLHAEAPAGRVAAVAR